MGVNTRLNQGFTLAEVLITLSIIGVVAGLTIPDLIAKNQEKQTVVQLKKAYNIFSNAYSLTQAKYGSVEDWGWENSNTVNDKLSSSLNITSLCYENTGCIPKTGYKFLGKSGVWPASSTGLSKAILADSNSFSVFSTKSNCTTVRGSDELEHICGVLYVDINGFKNPNTAGKDFFVFWITKDGIIPMGGPLEGDSDNPSSYLGYPLSKECKTGTGFGCTAWVILKENLDYLKQEVSW